MDIGRHTGDELFNRTIYTLQHYSLAQGTILHIDGRLVYRLNDMAVDWYISCTVCRLNHMSAV